MRGNVGGCSTGSPRRHIPAFPLGNVNFLPVSLLRSLREAEAERDLRSSSAATTSELNSDVRLRALQSIICRVRMTGASI